MTKTKNPKKGQKTLEYRYKRAFDILYKKQPKELQKLIDVAKNNPDLKHKEVDKFVTALVELVESDNEI